MSSKKILIVGGGIAGLTAALFLERAGHEIELIEKAPEFKPAGAGIVLWPNVLKILDIIGIRNDSEKKGNKLNDLRITNVNGKIISKINFNSMPDNFRFALGIHRSDFHRILVKTLKSTKVILNADIYSFEDKKKEIAVKFNNDRTESYDIIIGADGIHSSVRKLLFGNNELRYSGYTNWRFVIEPYFKLDRTVALEMWGKGKRFGIVPTGSNQIYCFVTQNCERGKYLNKDISLNEFKELTSEFKSTAKKIIDEIDDSTILINNDLEDVKLKQWTKGRVVLIGDAAHAVTPNLGLGAALAMEDAYELSKLLSVDEKPDISFSKFEAKRYKRASVIRNRSFRLGYWGQQENIFLQSIRNTAARIIPQKISGMILKKLIDLNSIKQ